MTDWTGQRFVLYALRYLSEAHEGAYRGLSRCQARF